MENILLYLKQKFCDHKVNYTIYTNRDIHGNVHARCLKCGKDLHADCYLNMDAKLVRTPIRRINVQVNLGEIIMNDFQKRCDRLAKLFIEAGKNDNGFQSKHPTEGN